MTSVAEMKEALLCPKHRVLLRVHGNSDVTESAVWTQQSLSCPNGCQFEIRGGVPRFVEASNYASAFGLQWQRYRRTQLDSYTGHPISRVRLERCLGLPLSKLAGKKVLEVGGGAGRFTELLVNSCELLVSSDLSVAVDANLANCKDLGSYLLLQADANSSPLPYEFFDVVICLGVLQHTPSPEQTIESLTQHLKPGGLLVIDHYTHPSWLSRVGSWLSLHYPLRAVLKRLSPAQGLTATIWLTSVADPIRRRTGRKVWLDRIVCRVLPTLSYYNSYPELDPGDHLRVE